MAQIFRYGEQCRAYAYEQITVSNTAVGFTASKLTNANFTAKPPCMRVLVTVETAQIRFNYDGSTPTSSLGHILNPGDTLVLEGVTNIVNFLAIRTGGTSGTINCTYESYLT